MNMGLEFFLSLVVSVSRSRHRTVEKVWPWQLVSESHFVCLSRIRQKNWGLNEDFASVSWMRHDSCESDPILESNGYSTDYAQGCMYACQNDVYLRRIENVTCTICRGMISTIPKPCSLSKLPCSTCMRHNVGERHGTSGLGCLP